MGNAMRTASKGCSVEEMPKFSVVIGLDKSLEILQWKRVRLQSATAIETEDKEKQDESAQNKSQQGVL